MCSLAAKSVRPRELGCSRRVWTGKNPPLTIMHLYFLHDGLTTDGRCVDEASEQETLDALSAFLEALRVKALEEAGGRRGVWILAGADQGWCAKGLPKNDAWRSVYSSRGAPTSWATEGIPDYPDALAEVLMMAFGAGRGGSPHEAARLIDAVALRPGRSYIKRQGGLRERSADIRRTTRAEPSPPPPDRLPSPKAGDRAGGQGVSVTIHVLGSLWHAGPSRLSSNVRGS